MTTFIYVSANHMLVEKASIEKPYYPFFMSSLSEHMAYDKQLLIYEVHIKSLRTIPCSKDFTGIDGKQYKEGIDFTVEPKYSLNYETGTKYTYQEYLRNACYITPATEERFKDWSTLWAVPPKYKEQTQEEMWDQIIDIIIGTEEDFNFRKKRKECVSDIIAKGYKISKSK